MLLRVLLLTAAASCNALLVPAAFSRREVVRSVGALAAGPLLAPAARAFDSDAKYDPECTTCTSIFAGSYTDERTGGTRTVTLLKQTAGRYREARVSGGGGEDEPASFTIPARVKLDDSAISLNLSPGGPSDFEGTLDGTAVVFPPTPRQASKGATKGSRWVRAK